jgi:hypothetical protein
VPPCAEPSAQPLHYRERQSAPAVQYVTGALGAAQERDEIDLLQPVLVHQIADHLGRARNAQRPFFLFVGDDQTRLSGQPREILGSIRGHQAIDQGLARASSASSSITIVSRLHTDAVMFGVAAEKTG